MLLRELFEDKSQTVGIIFGRFNPPHKGHKAAWEMASKADHWLVGTNKSTQGPKDPLPFDVKIEAMKTIWPEVSDHIVAETSWLTLASKVYKEYGDVHLLCFTDEDWVTKTIQQYNGQEGPHGFYQFSKIEQVSTPRLSSATALRNAVIKNNRDEFSQAAGISADTLIGDVSYFDLVSHYLKPYIGKTKKVKEARRTDIGRSLAANVSQIQRREGTIPLSDIESKVSKYIDTHIAAYKNKRLDADALGNFLLKVGKFVTQKYNLDPQTVKIVINSYVEHKLNEDLKEASYKGNVGIMELFKFFNEAKKNNDIELINHVKELINNGENLEVWKIIQDYVGTKLIGKEFGN